MQERALLAACLLIPSVAFATPNPIPDGDFELGVANLTDYWQQTSSQGLSLIGTLPGTQNNAARMGVVNQETSAIIQHVQLDYDMSELTWRSSVTSTEPCGPKYDRATVYAHTPSAGWRFHETELCNPGIATFLWYHVAMPMSGYAGETLTVLVVVENDVWAPSIIDFDDFSTR